MQMKFVFHSLWRARQGHRRLVRAAMLCAHLESEGGQERHNDQRKRRLQRRGGVEAVASWRRVALSLGGVNGLLRGVHARNSHVLARTNAVVAEVLAWRQRRARGVIWVNSRLVWRAHVSAERQHLVVEARVALGLAGKRQRSGQTSVSLVNGFLGATSLGVVPVAFWRVIRWVNSLALGAIAARDTAGAVDDSDGWAAEREGRLALRRREVGLGADGARVHQQLWLQLVAEELLNAQTLLLGNVAAVREQVLRQFWRHQRRHKVPFGWHTLELGELRLGQLTQSKGVGDAESAE